jgi:hypothetical protein
VAALLTVGSFAAVIGLGAIVEVVIERVLGVDDIEITMRRRGARKEVR